HNEVDTAQIGDQVRHHAAPDHRGNLLQVRETGRPDPGAVAHGAAVAGQVVAVDALGRLDHLQGLIGRHHRPPGDLEEVGDQRLDVLERSLLRRRRGQRVVRLVRAFGHVVQALLDDAQAFAHLAHLDHAAVVGIAIGRQRHLELEVLVAGVGACLAQIEVAAGGPQPGTGHTPFQRFPGVVTGYTFGTTDQDAVLQRRLLVFIQALGHPVKELANQPVPATGQVVGDAADAIPGRVHTEAGDGLDHLVRPLPVGEGEEHRGHGADVLDEGAQEQQVVLDTEELGHHDADHIDPLRHLDAGQLFHGEHIGQVVHHPAEVVDPVGIGDVAVPALALTHLFRATVVVADLRYAVDDLLAIE